MKTMIVFYAGMAAVAFIAAVVMFSVYNGTGFVACGIIGIISTVFHIIYGKFA